MKMLRIGVIYKVMHRCTKNVLNSLAVIVCIAFAIKPLLSQADVYGGGYWEVIGLGNMPCEELSAKTKDEAYRELTAVWLSGFMSGVNFTSEDVYDITWGEDVYVLRNLVLKGCEQHPDKVLADIASEIIYQRYQDKNFISQDQITK